MSTSAPRRTIDVIDRRVGLMFGVFLLLLGLGVARAGYLGLFRAGALRAAGASQQIQRTVIPAVRGELTDRNGVVLALDEPTDDVDVDPYLIAKTYRDPSSIAAKLAPLLRMTRVDVVSDLTRSNTGYVKLASSVPAATAAEIIAMHINGIWDVATEHRSYPRGTEAAQVIGWTGSADDGLAGIEQVFNGELKGSSGVRHTVVDAQGKAISVVTNKPMVAGKNIALTISAPLQSEVEQVLAGVGRKYKAAGATAIVTDPQTDQILALANWPSVNPNAVPSNAFTPVNGDVAAAEDQAVDMSYEPGSTFKAVTVAGALQDGVVTPDTHITVPSYLDPYGRKITDAEPHGTEDLTVAQILKVSSNIGADLIAQRMGANSFASWVNKFGFGKRTGVALQGEQTGIVLPESRYSGVSMYNLPFGQGESVTPMQMIQAYDAIANGGILRTPQIIDSIAGRKTVEPRGKRIISTKVASELRGMLRGVLADGGTASGAAIPGYNMAGKTGTAQVVVNGKYSKSYYIASFIGMVPANDPKLVVAVVVNDPRTGVVYGGSVAAPAFQQIVGWAVPHFGINPCPSPCPKSAMDAATPSSL
jgi:cell division protein FtsI/penicillin-binding protein 2